jgi:hypothetical protein
MPELSDNELRKLFQQAGRPPMATDLSDRIMARVAVTPIHQPLVVKPVIGRAGWFAIAAGFIGLLAFLFNAAGTTAGTSSLLDPLWQNVPRIQLSHIALPTGQWTLWAAVIAGGMLMLALMDRVLERVVK